MTQAAINPGSQRSTQAGYERVDPARIEQGQAQEVTEHLTADQAQTAIRWAVIPLSVGLCIAQALLTIYACDVKDMFLTSTLIPVVAFVVLFALVLGLNPALRLAEYVLGRWARPLNRVELVCLFAAMFVSAGISTFGLTEQLIPLLATPNNPEWNVPQRGWNQELIPSLNPSLYIQDPQVIKTFRQGVTHAADGSKLVAPKDTAGWAAYLRYGANVAWAIPWGAWVAPLAYWMVFIGACYGMFYCLTYVVLGYWADREKLIFPLARLPEALLPAATPGTPGTPGSPGTPGIRGGSLRHTVPAIFRMPGFWLGFLISFGVLAWNGLTTSGHLPGLSPIPLGMTGGSFKGIVSGSIFEGIGARGDFSVMFLILFTAIGISFLLPLEISFSVWFYYLVGRLLLLVLIWSGRGQSVTDFPSDWLWLNNPVTALGGGGIFLFSAVSLYRCARDFQRLVAGKGMGQRLVIGLPVIGLAACMAVATLWLMWNRLPLGWAVLFVFCLTLLTIGLMRIVAEGGIYWFQSHTSFFHVYKMLGLGRWLAPTLLAPLLPIYSVLFLDTKTFLAPNLLNAADMQKSAGGSRAKFHINILLCLAASVIVSLGFAIILAHIRGGQAMQSWFYNSATPMMLDTAQRAISDPPHFDLGTTLWYLGGAAWVGLSIILRTTLFWFPHPIGFIMLINPLGSQLSFSFFLGWLCKKFVVKYGGKATFDRVRMIFIGLILGELMAIAFWTALALLASIPSQNITLNRYN